MREALIRDMLFADGAAVSSHTEEDLQHLMDRFYLACPDFVLAIRLMKTNVMAQDVDETPTISIDGYVLEVIHDCTYLGSTIADGLSLEAELNKRIAGAATTLSRLKKRVRNNNKLTVRTQMQVYKACVPSTLL